MGGRSLSHQDDEKIALSAPLVPAKEGSTRAASGQSISDAAAVGRMGDFEWK